VLAMTERVSVGVSGVALYKLHSGANYGHKSTLNLNNNFFILVPNLATHTERAEKKQEP